MNRLVANMSAAARRQRAGLHNHVLNGGSLTLMLRDHVEPLNTIEIRRLARWVPMVGPRKAQRILLGLPERYPLGWLTPRQREVFTQRVAEAEIRSLNRTIRNHYQEK